MTKPKHHNHKTAFVIIFSLIVIVSCSYFYAAEKRKIHLSNMVKYHTKMVKSGSISSLVKLGEMYEKGEGVKKDLSKAQELFKKAINFNKYIDEIYPSYSEYDTNENGRNDYQNSDENNKTNTTIQLNNIRANLKETEIITPQRKAKKTSLSKNKSSNHKYIPYFKSKQKFKNKSTFSNVLVLDINSQKKPTKHKPTKKIRAKNTFNKKIPAKNKVTLRDTSKNKTKYKKASKKSKLVYSKKYTTKSTTGNRKITKPKIKYKKSIVIKPVKKSVKKKVPLQAKRSPTLYEERPDYETEQAIFNDEALNDSGDDDNVISIQKDTKKQQIGRNFTSNPCATASARYIANCRRKNKSKNK